MTQRGWVMPKWMEPFRGFFQNTGGNSVEFLMNDQSPWQINAIRAMLAVGVKSQVGLLEKLRKENLLIYTSARQP